MIQLTSSLTSNYHLLTLLIILFAFINNHQISANSFSNRYNYPQISPIYDDLSSEDNDGSNSATFIDPNSFYIPDNEEIMSRNPWPKLFRRYSDRSVIVPPYDSRTQTGFPLRRGEIHYIPYLGQKRAIPIEFQKALFAHGIVGRR